MSSQKRAEKKAYMDRRVAEGVSHRQAYREWYNQQPELQLRLLRALDRLLVRLLEVSLRLQGKDEASPGEPAPPKRGEEV